MSKEITDMMTVSKLKSILAEYDNEQIVVVNGGEDENGTGHNMQAKNVY